MIEVKLLHQLKQFEPIEVTDEGMVIEVNLLQPEKTEFPNDVTDEAKTQRFTLIVEQKLKKTPMLNGQLLL